MGLVMIAGLAMATTDFKPVFNPKLMIERTSVPIKIDGILDDAGWQSAGRTSNFVERFLGDMTEPEVRTDAHITYDEDHLYVGFFCYDVPASIRATMCQRDQFGGDIRLSRSYCIDGQYVLTHTQEPNVIIIRPLAESVQATAAHPGSLKKTQSEV